MNNQGNPYVGLYYAFEGLGGYDMEEGLPNVELIPSGNVLTQYDVTGSVQIYMNVRLFNEKLGLYKDANNYNILSTSFNEATGQFPVDTIYISATEFLQNIRIPNILSVGKLETLYTDFIQYVNTYFSYANGCSTIFNPGSQMDINGGIFDAEQFVSILNGKTYDPATGQYIQDLSGEISIFSVNEMITDVVFSNPFLNRAPNGFNGAPFTLRNGFIEGDLLFIPSGITISLNVTFIQNGVSINDLGVSIPKNECYCFKKGYFSSNTTVTDTNITMTVHAPLLIKLIQL
jgi:hypothetical protein